MAVKMTSPCSDCGQIHTRCKGHRKGTGKTEPCMRYPRGEAVACDSHGGRTPQARAKSDRQVTEGKARKVLGLYGIVADDQLERVDPIEELQKALSRARNAVLWLEDHVAGLGLYDLVQETGKDGEKAGVWLDLLNSERDRYNALLVQAQKLGLREREVELAETQQQMLLGVLVHVLTHYGLQPDPLELAGIVESGLRQLSA